MSHLTVERLMELSRSRPSEGATPSGEETAHLTGCAGCRDALAAERELGEALRAAGSPSPSASFVVAAQARFVAARRAQEVRRGVLVSVAAAVLVTAAALLAGLLAVVAAKPLAVVAAQALKDVAIFLELAATLLTGSSLVPLAAVATCAGAVVLATAVMMHLSRAAAVAK